MNCEGVIVVDNFSAIRWRERNTVLWDEDDVCFAQDQHFGWTVIMLAHW